jgi:hypothetical protein
MFGTEESLFPKRDEQIPKPWRLLGAGMAAIVVAGCLAAWGPGRQSAPFGTFLVIVRLALLGGGLVAAGIAVTRRPRSAMVLALAGLAAWGAGQGLDQDWDSARALLHVLAVVAGVAAGLVCLPRAVGRAAVSLLILIHFGGILTAVTSVPPPGGAGPWLANQLWTRFYRPYLQFMYLNNAYHFYSPEPGPATLVWGYLRYADGSSRWVEIPNRREHVKDALANEYYRRLAMNESINRMQPIQPAPAEVARRRLLAGELGDIPSPSAIAQHLPGVAQYQVPADTARHLLTVYARFLAHTYPADDRSVGVASVKLYRVIHGLIPPGNFAAGDDPLDPTLYVPYYQGEFDADGNLLDPNDPFLYWLIPILKFERAPGGLLLPAGLAAGRTPGPSANPEVRDYVSIHAESEPRRWHE